METEFARLMLNEEEEAVSQIQVEPNTEKEGGGFSTGGGVQIWDLGEKRFLFQFFHVMDLERIHDVPISFFSKNLAMQLGNFIRNFMEYDSSNLGKENHNFMRIRVQIDIWHPLKRKKQVMFYGNCSYVRFKALVMNSAWLREEGEGELGGNREGSRVPGNNLWDLGKKVGYRKNSLASQAQIAMDHDLEDGVLIEEEGKKRARGRLKN
ncbi:hypothetical protein Gohar_004210 [Gossypium harknessii]|uniref:Uncharacterized protein n=1 Tax=Gossypium harknessii TaxID=34285 RepID=A0A7J9H4V3_9ROSI|nr:hypothetical protein [Gossypium harknessii]